MTRGSVPALRFVLWSGLALVAAIVAFQSYASAAPLLPPGDESVTTEQATDAPSYALDFRWSLWGWLGATGVDIMDAFAGNTSPDGDLSDRVTAVYTWDSEEQAWRGFFPAAEGVPGVNDFTTFTRFTAYHVAITEGPSATFIPALP